VTTDNIAIPLTQLRHDAIIEMFVLDATVLGGGITRFHASTNGLRQQLVWQGQAYQPFPIEAEGFARTSSGTMPRPRLRVANINGLIGLMVLELGGLKGATLIRKQALRKHLDAVNFPGGVNPGADPSAHYPDERWLIDRTAKRDRYMVEFELGSPFDVAGVKLPRRQVLAQVCTFEYRGAECGYVGGPVAKADDSPTADGALDDCSHSLKGCKLRQWPGNELPFGGFPGAGVLRQV
jgi:lambda family phage minor tail protein L